MGTEVAMNQHNDVGAEMLRRFGQFGKIKDWGTPLPVIMSMGTGESKPTSALFSQLQFQISGLDASQVLFGEPQRDAAGGSQVALPVQVKEEHRPEPTGSPIDIPQLIQESNPTNAANESLAKDEVSEVSPKRKHPEDEEDNEDCVGPHKKKMNTSHMTRGAHVKARPEMHANARSGQRHWGSQVQQLRLEWEEKRVGQAFPHFLEQIRMCTRSHIKSQHECLLRMLQISALEGIIIPKQFVNDEKESFLGWTGFQINPHRVQDFQRRISSMFECATKQNTINNAFRRAGLVPDQCWGRAWSGLATFQYKPDKRAVYNRSPVAQDSNAGC